MEDWEAETDSSPGWRDSWIAAVPQEGAEAGSGASGDSEADDSDGGVRGTSSSDSDGKDSSKGTVGGPGGGQEVSQIESSSDTESEEVGRKGEYYKSMAKKHASSSSEVEREVKIKKGRRLMRKSKAR